MNWFNDIKDIRVELYNEWQSSGDINKRKYLLNKLMETHPETIDYLWTTAMGIYGEHRVYLIKIQYKGIDYIKVGYTKNTIQQRFSEKRYNGAEDFKLIEIIKEQKLQAGGAVEFERYIKSKIETIQTEMKMPGKGELFEVNKLNELIDLWNSSVNDYVNVVKIKSPN
jgi:hypothetical protein